jgi:hypothetical protein
MKNPSQASRSPASRRKRAAVVIALLVNLSLLCWVEWRAIDIAGPTFGFYGLGIAAIFLVAQVVRLRQSSPVPPTRKKPSLRLVK